MRIEELSVVVRPRTFWAAMDLGPVLVRKWWSSIYPPWLLLVICLVAVPLGWVFRDDPALALLCFWWLKPLPSRVLLYVMSREMFGVHVSTRETLMAFPRMAFRLPFFLRMTLFRMSANRGVLLPIWMLEGLKGSDRSKRESLMRSQIGGSAFWVTCLFMFFELLVLMPGLYRLAIIMLPNSLHHFLPEAEVFFSSWFCYISYVMVVAFLEPFYMAVCFALYLNCRTILEGWDLELAFRRLNERLSKQAARLGVMGVLLWAVLLCGVASQPALAQDSADPVAEESAQELPGGQQSRESVAKADKEAITRILNEKPFAQEKETGSFWRLREFDTPKSEQGPLPKMPNLFGQLATYLIYFVTALVFLVLLGFIIKGLMSRQRDMPSDENVKANPRGGPVLSDLIQAESLPDNIMLEAEKAFAAGDARRSLSLLFRGALKALADSDKLDIAGFATEGDCLKQVRRNMDASYVSFFTQLVRSWQNVAYGHKAMEKEAFEVLCKDWLRQTARFQT